MCPLSTVEKESFIYLVDGLASRRTLLTRKTLSIEIDDAHNSMIDRLNAQINSAEYVCMTADIWSTNNKSYFGMTVHWIDDDLTRKSVALGGRVLTRQYEGFRILDLWNPLWLYFDFKYIFEARFFLFPILFVWWSGFSINQSISMNLLWRPTSKALGRQKYSENTTA